MMVPHYTLVEPAYYSGLDLAWQAFGVALVEQKAMVVVGQVVEQKSRKRVVFRPPPLMRCIPLRLRLSIGLK